MSNVVVVAVKIGAPPFFVLVAPRNTQQKIAPPNWRIESPHLDVLQEHAFSLRSRKDPRRIGPPPRISGPATHPHCLKSAQKKTTKKARIGGGGYLPKTGIRYGIASTVDAPLGADQVVILLFLLRL